MVVVAIVALVSWLQIQLTNDWLRIRLFGKLIGFSTLLVLISVAVFLTYLIERLAAPKDKSRETMNFDATDPPEPK
jgi:hypothetical protein